MTLTELTFVMSALLWCGMLVLYAVFQQNGLLR